jgi:hypothetical protein
MFSAVPKQLAGTIALVATIGLTGCGSGSTTAKRGCFDVWNAKSNQVRQTSIAGRFRVANVSEWRAAAASHATTPRGSPANQGCGYLFHTSKRYLSISGAWTAEAFRWNVPPSIHSSWSSGQQAAVKDNASVNARGLLSHL